MRKKTKPAKAPKPEKGAKRTPGKAEAGPVVQERPRGPSEKPRLARHYLEKVRAALVEKFKYKSTMQAPHWPLPQPKRVPLRSRSFRRM